MKRIFAFLLTAALITGCTACSTESDGEYPVKLANYTISEKPESIVCLSDSVADIMIACGYADRITARSDECTQDELASVPSVGSKDNPDTKKILKADPDIVFADKTINEGSRKTLKDSTNIVVMMPAKSTEDLTALYESICAVTDGDKSGRENGCEKSKSILVTLADLQRIIPESDIVKTACYLYDAEGNAAADSTFEGKLLSYANLTNVCAVANSSSDAISKIRLSEPDYIFCAEGVKSKIEKDANFKDLKAVKNGNVYEIEDDLIQRQGNSLPQVLSYMIETIYPDVSGSTESKSSDDDNSAKETSKDESSKKDSGKTESSKSESSDSDKSENSTNSSEVSSETSKVKADNSLKITDDMEYGMEDEGEDIIKIQNRLHELGYFDEESTGYFGDLSCISFKAFEEANGLEADGYADNAALKLLFSAKAKPASTTSEEETSEDE